MMPAYPAWEEFMDNFAELMRRLLEVQSGERHRSAKLIEEDKRLMDRLGRRSLVGQPSQTVQLSQAIDETMGERN